MKLKKDGGKLRAALALQHCKGSTLHGGINELFSAGASMGSEITTWLPALAAAETSRDADMRQPAPATTGCRVLVVDDEPDVTDSMSTLLQIEGHEVKTANCGEAALALAREFRPRLVLLDIGLHDMDGYEVARRLRVQQPETEKICLVAVTGYGHAEARARTKEAGFDLHLTKPVFPEAIFKLLVELKTTGCGMSDRVVPDEAIADKFE